jgi:hypothetical protein
MPCKPLSERQRASGKQTLSDGTATGWRRLDKAAFGIIYGAIMVLSILLAQGNHPAPPLETAVIMFGSVLAITLAKAFAEFLSHALDTRERMTEAVGASPSITAHRRWRSQTCRLYFSWPHGRIG